MKARYGCDTNGWYEVVEVKIAVGHRTEAGAGENAITAVEAGRAAFRAEALATTGTITRAPDGSLFIVDDGKLRPLVAMLTPVPLAYAIDHEVVFEGDG